MGAIKLSLDNRFSKAGSRVRKWVSALINSNLPIQGREFQTAEHLLEKEENDTRKGEKEECR